MLFNATVVAVVCVVASDAAVGVVTAVSALVAPAILFFSAKPLGRRCCCIYCI